MSPEDATNIIMTMTKPLLKNEVWDIMTSVYNSGYDDGRQRGYEMALADVDETMRRR